jgi:hypothetical protein
MTVKYEVNTWMTVKYEVKTFGKDRIVQVKCVKETEKTLWVETENWRGRKNVSMRRKDPDFYDTWEEAHAELLKRAEANLNHARLALQRAQGEYGNVKGMANPDVQP